MKKTLIALAALAATSAFAQSTVTLSGVLKTGVAQTNYSNGVGPTAVNGNGLSLMDGSSRFILSGAEDLGGGLKALFQIDNRFRVDGPATFSLGGGNTFVGLSGGFGSFLLGNLDTHYGMGADGHATHATSLQSSSIGLLNYVNGKEFGPGSNGIANASRSTNVIRYNSPDMSGFKGQLSYSTAPFGNEGTVGNAGQGRAYHGALNYAAGPLKAGVSLWNAQTEDRRVAAPRADQKAATLFADYTFGMASVGLTYDDSLVNGGLIGGANAELRRKAWSIPVNVHMGPGMIMLAYTQARDATLNGTTVANTGARMFSVGYDYSLSKRTSLGVSYVKLDNKANAGYGLYTQAALGGTPTNIVGQDASQLYAGVRHAF